EVLDDLATTLVPPDRGGSDLLSVLESQRVRQLRKGIGRRLIVVGVIRGALVTARARPQTLDGELVHHVLMILGGRPTLWFRRLLRHQERATAQDCRPADPVRNSHKKPQ